MAAGEQDAQTVPPLLKKAKAMVAFNNDSVTVTLDEFIDAAGDIEASLDVVIWSSDKDNTTKKRFLTDTITQDVDGKTKISFTKPFKRPADQTRWNVCLKAKYSNNTKAELYGFGLGVNGNPPDAFFPDESKTCLSSD